MEKTNLDYRRVTLLMPENLNEKLRKIQTKQINKSGDTYSFSQTIIDLLEKAVLE